MPYLIHPTYTLKWLVHWELDLEGDSVDWEKVMITQRTKHVPETAIAEMPRRFICKPRTPHIPDFAYRDGVWFVSPEVRSVIESLEPGVHDFYEVRILNKKTKKDETFFVLRIGQAIDAVVIEETKFDSGFGWPGYEKSPYPSLSGPIALRADPIVGKHLWRGGGSAWGVSPIHSGATSSVPIRSATSSSGTISRNANSWNAKFSRASIFYPITHTISVWCGQ